MNKKAPRAMLTDQNMWLKEALVTEMPGTKHAFCIWHIISKFSEWFSALLGSHYDNWKSEFHRLYNLNSVDEFEVEWRNMVEKYQLHGNKHIVSLYALRTYWALPFLQSYFFAGMTNTSHSESINSYIQRLLAAHSALGNFVEQVVDFFLLHFFICKTVVFFDNCLNFPMQVASIAEAKDQAGTKQKLQQKAHKVSLKTGSPIELHAATVLTPYAFSKLQEELVVAPKYASLMVDETCFIVRHHTETDGGCKVLWAPRDEFISCSCHFFEFTGILCRHILRVLSTNNCFHIPDLYLPMRWRDVPSTSSSKTLHSSSPRDHTEKMHLFQSMISSLIAESTETEERLDVACEQISMVLNRLKGLHGPSHAADDDITYDHSASDSLIFPEVEDSDCIVQSFTSHQSLPKLKDRRTEDGANFYRKKRRFTLSCSGQFNQDANQCPLMGNDDVNGEEVGFL